jgi:hypothetical protein
MSGIMSDIFFIFTKKIVTNLLNFINQIFENRWFKYSVFIFFCFILGWLKFDHIFERDESQVLLLVIHNSNFFDLISALGYEGSTGLWHIILWLFSKFIVITPQSANLIHFGFVVVFIWLLFFRLKVPFIFKIIFVLQISVLFNFLYVRQYILILLNILLLTLAIINKKDWLVGIFTMILMQTHLIAIPIAISFSIYYFFSEEKKYYKKIVINFGFLITGLFIAIIQLWPPDDLMVGLKTWKMDFSFYQLFVEMHKIMGDMFSTSVTLINITLVTVLICVLLLKDRNFEFKNLIFLFASFTISFVAYLTIGVTKYIGVNHNIFLFYTLLAFIIIVFNWTNRTFNFKWYIILVPIMLYCGYLYKVQIANYKYAPFSHADKVAEFLDEHYKTNPVLFAPESHMNSVVLYRKNSKPVYSLGRNDYCYYVKWNHPCVDHLTIKTSPIKLNDLENWLRNVPDSIWKKQPVLIISTELNQYIIDENGQEINGDFKIYDNISFKLIKRFEEPKANWLTEKFLIYECIKT